MPHPKEGFNETTLTATMAPHRIRPRGLRNQQRRPLTADVTRTIAGEPHSNSGHAKPPDARNQARRADADTTGSDAATSTERGATPDPSTATAVSAPPFRADGESVLN
jgi:hypothetical protein